MFYSFFSVSLSVFPHIMHRIVILVFPLSRVPCIFRFVNPHFMHVSGSWIRMVLVILGRVRLFFYCVFIGFSCFDYVSLVVVPFLDYGLSFVRLVFHRMPYPGGVLSWLLARCLMKPRSVTHVSASVYPHSTAVLDNLYAWPFPYASMVNVNGFFNASLSFARIFTNITPTSMLRMLSKKFIDNQR